MDGEPLPMFEAPSGASCALPDDQLRERIDALARIGDDLIESRVDGDLHVLVFRASPEVRRALEQIVAAERECCSFLDLTIEDRPATGQEPGRLVLTVAAPPEGALVAAGFAAAFGAA
ncbi:MAG TPA: hypothetical protein VGI17_00335 [Solirubrobacterales bacterium]